MYPNQGYPGQYPSNPPFGAGYPPQMPQPSQMPQPFGSGYPPQQPSYGMPQPSYGQPPAMPNYGIPGYGQAPQMQPPMPTFGQAPPMQAPYGQAPQMPSFGQESAPYGQAPQMPAYGQQPSQPPYGQQASQPPYGQQPSQPPYGQPAQPSYPSAPNAFPQTTPNYSSPQATPTQSYGSYGSPQQQPVQQPIQAQQYATSYSSSPTAQTRKGRPTVHPAPNFDASNDAAALRKAMKGFGTDEDGLINILCRRPSHQRVEIVRAYKTAYGKDLFEDIRSETSGNFQSVLIALLMPRAEYYCRELYEAMVGAGTDEDPLIEVMCTMSNQEIREVGMMYQRMFGQSLESHLRSDTSGNMKRLMTSLSVGGRDESMRTDVNSARQDAEALKRAGIGRFGTDESEFNRILCLRNYEQLKLVCQEYEKLTGNTLEKDIKREFSGDIEDALLSIIRVANNRPEFFARRLHKSMAGLGTNDRSLIRLCVTRSEIDMEDIKQEFQRYYGKTLKSFIKGDTSGHYKHALYVLCGENRT